MNLFKKCGLTLIEMMLSILLLSLILVTALSIELGARRIFVNTDTEGKFLAEMTAILTEVSSSIIRASGSYAFDMIPFSTVIFGNNDYTFRLRYDTNHNLRADRFDGWAAYCWNNTTHEVIYFPDTVKPENNVTLTAHCVNFAIFPAFPINETNGTAMLMVTLRRDPENTPNYTNPELTGFANVSFRGVSLR